MSSGQKAKHPVQSTQNTFRVLEGLQEMDGAGVTELAEHLNLSKSSVHNYLDTLRHEGYVVKDGHRYRVGLRFLDLGAYARHQEKIFEIGKPEVQQLAAETGEVANLLVEERGKGVFLYREQGPQAVKLHTYTGKSVHLHNTALGKAIMAYMPEDRVRSILDRHGLPKRTAETITDPDDLFAELDAVRERGYALDREEHLDGLRCVAVPIRSNNATVEGAISVSGPSSRMRGDRWKESILRKLENAANVVELNITYS